MKYSQYYPTDYLNGEGVRSVLFVSGCTHACRGCYNQSTWSPNKGTEYSEELEEQIIADLKDTRIVRDGITLTGGDPMHVANTRELLGLCQRIREECPTKTIWMWTGYTHEELLKEASPYRIALLNIIDVLVDGRYDEELKDANLKFRGSSNQRIIHLAKPL